MQWPGSVKTCFAFHIELGYAIADLVHGILLLMEMQYAYAVHDHSVWSCAVNDHLVAVVITLLRSPNFLLRK